MMNDKYPLDCEVSKLGIRFTHSDWRRTTRWSTFANSQHWTIIIQPAADTPLWPAYVVFQLRNNLLVYAISLEFTIFRNDKFHFTLSPSDLWLPQVPSLPSAMPCGKSSFSQKVVFPWITDHTEPIHAPFTWPKSDGRSSQNSVLTGSCGESIWVNWRSVEK